MKSYFFANAVDAGVVMARGDAATRVHPLPKPRSHSTTRLHDELVRIAWRMAGHRQDAEDIVQAALLRELESGLVWRSEAVRRAWLVTVVRRLVFDRARSKRRQFAATLNIDEIPVGPEYSEEPWAKITTEQLQGAVAHCKPHLRLVYEMYYGLGLSQTDIAAALSISPRTVATRLYRARDQLRTILGPTLRCPQETEPVASVSTCDANVDTPSGSVKRCSKRE